MKANTPEKIYLYSYPTDGIYEVETEPLEGTVEYVRTDTFIEKAEKYLNDRLLNYIEYCKRGVGVSTEEFIEEFLKAMEK